MFEHRKVKSLLDGDGSLVDNQKLKKESVEYLSYLMQTEKEEGSADLSEEIKDENIGEDEEDDKEREGAGGRLKRGRKPRDGKEENAKDLRTRKKRFIK